MTDKEFEEFSKRIEESKFFTKLLKWLMIPVALMVLYTLVV